MKRRFSERRIVVSLMALLAIEAALLLAHLGILSFDGPRDSSGEAVAGYIVKSHNQLRRRGMNSLVWEKSNGEEPVYFHDSVLTLSQSTATLKLFQDTEVSLSENTLVTIEPQDQREHGEIRLKFVKGNLQARNPYHPTRIDGSAWTVDVHQGSEIEFRQVGDDDFEVQVKKGEATFQSAGGGAASVVKPSEMLRIDGEKAASVALDDSLEWEEPPASRIYAHSDFVPVVLRWKGHASSLVLQSLGQAEKLITPAEDGRETLVLPIGQHRLFLREGGKSSAALDVQVWRAPLIHLLRPLPRDRAGVGASVQFVWTQLPGVETYRVVTKGAHNSDELNVDGNVTSTRFGETDDVEWSVFGRDGEGVEIPPLYTNPLFIRESPLAAPKLRVPSVRKPAADEGASYWWRLDLLLLPQARADDRTAAEAVFEWEPVDGADQYVIEISETADFRSPVLVKTLTRSQYAWRGFQEKTYYWRVAAGTKRGRMGVFSEAARADLGDLNGEHAGVEIRKVPVAPKAPVVQKASEPPARVAPVEPVKPVAPPAVVAVAEPEPIRVPRIGRFVGWSPRFTSAGLRAKDKVKANMSGGTMTGVALESPVAISERKVWRVGISFAQTEFKPDPAEKYPYQRNLSWQDLRGSALYYKSWWGYGATVRQTFTVKRESEETLSGDSEFRAGPAIGALIRGGSYFYSGNMAVTGSSGGAGVETTHSIRFNLFRGISIGGGVEAELRLSSPSSVVTGAFGLAGFEF